LDYRCAWSAVTLRGRAHTRTARRRRDAGSYHTDVAGSALHIYGRERERERERERARV